jgi:transcriptional regulator with XRE-family HTH domain
MGSNKIIGNKIKGIRQAKQLTLEEMAERSGLKAEQVERIENNIEFPSLAPLIKIARVLGVRLGTFLDDQVELGPVISRKKDIAGRAGIDFSNNESQGRKHMRYHALSPDKSGRHMEPFLIDVYPSVEGVDFVLSSHEGEEFIYVLEGMIEVNYGNSIYVLEEGDSIYYDSIVAHHVHAASDEATRILGVVYTPY